MKILPKIFLAFALIVSMSVFCLTPAFAATTHEGMEHGTKSEAAVSEELDEADNYTPSMSTQMYVYIPKETKKPVPDMGDIGIDTDNLLIMTIGVGIAYLACNHYANKDIKPKTCEIS